MTDDITYYHEIGFGHVDEPVDFFRGLFIAALLSAPVWVALVWGVLRLR